MISRCTPIRAHITYSRNKPLLCRYRRRFICASNKIQSFERSYPGIDAPSTQASSSSIKINEKLSRFIHKVERLGKENKMSTLSHVLKDASKQKILDQLLKVSLELVKAQPNSRRRLYDSSHRSAFSYILDSLIKSRSPGLLQLLKCMDTDRDALQFISTNKLILAASYISSHIRLMRNEKDSHLELNIGFFDKLILKDDLELCFRYIDELDLPDKNLLESLSISSPYEKHLLHMHILTKHLAKWCYVAHCDDSQVGAKIFLLHDVIRRTVRYDPILTSTLMMNNLRKCLPNSVTLVNKFCTSIFFATCADILLHGGSLKDVKRFHWIVTSNELVNFRNISYDGYGFALKKIFREYAVTSLNDATLVGEVPSSRNFNNDQFLVVNYLLSFICENSMAAAKLRYLFIRCVLSYSFLDSAKKLTEFVQSQRIPLGTVLTNHCVRVFATHGDFEAVRDYIQVASREACTSSLLKPPSQLEVGLDPSTLSSFLIGTESWLGSKSLLIRGNEEYRTHLTTIEVILNSLLDRVEEYRLAPNLKLFQRVLDFNEQWTKCPSIALQCVNLALRVGKQQPKELHDQILKSNSEDHNGNIATSIRYSEFNPNFEKNSGNRSRTQFLSQIDNDSHHRPDQSIVIEKFFSEVVLQLCQSDAYDLFSVVDLILRQGHKIESKVLNFVFAHYITMKRYRIVIELFERLSNYDVPRSFEQASAVIEALAKMNRFSDCWRSITSLKPYIFDNIYSSEQSDEIQLWQRTKCLAVFASRGLLQLTLLFNGEDGDDGKVKMPRSELLSSVLYCIERIIASHHFVELGVSRFETNSQDMLLLHLCLFRSHTDKALVDAVFNEVKLINSRAKVIVNFVESFKADDLPSNMNVLL